ncbi:MAG: GGDEF domain-containing protein, partial [Sulfuriferula sp.]
FAIIDIDHLNAANDQHGRQVGDAILKTVADTAIQLLRTVDRFGRLDNDQFGIVLPATWLDHGLIAMDRLTKAVAACDWTSIAPGLTVTFSGGITTNAPKDTIEVVIKRTEKMLTQAKQDGGNRTAQMEEALPDSLPWIKFKCGLILMLGQLVTAYREHFPRFALAESDRIRCGQYSV